MNQSSPLQKQEIRGGLRHDGPRCKTVDPTSAPKPKIEQPAAIRTMWVLGLISLALLVLADLGVHHHEAVFGFETSFGFSAWYGFATCLLMVIVSKKVVGQQLSVRDTYYDD